MSMPTKSILPSNTSSNGLAVLAPPRTALALEIEPADPALVLPLLPSTLATTEVLVFMHSSVCQFPSTMSRRATLSTVPPVSLEEAVELADGGVGRSLYLHLV